MMEIWESTNSKDWERSGLEDYLLYDKWRILPAFYVLAGYHYGAEQSYGGDINIKYALNDRIPFVIQKGFDDFDSFATDEYTEAAKEASSMEKIFDRLHRFWMNNQIGNESLPPKVLTEWALSKRIRPAWLDWAIERGLYIPKNETAQPAQIANAPVFDKEADTYPPDLAIALQAWQAVSVTDGRGKPKARIRTWLDNHETYKKLPNETKERICTVANWDKAGGATKFD